MERKWPLAGIWDLRRGDDDDDRTSLYSRGLWNVAFSAALEFSYLKALIGFVALVIAPAVLLGVVLSVVVSYGRLKLHAATLAGSRPIFAFFLLAVLAGVVWLSRPLIEVVFDNFWYLRYSLVLPTFVVFREVLRAAVERVPGGAMSQERLHHSRQIGTVIAALLFAAAGITVALTVEVSIGLQLIDVEHVQPWSVLKAALGNAAAVLGLSTTLESFHWFWRELKLWSPVRDWAPDLSNAETQTVRVAHISDSHLVGERYGYRMESGTHGPRGNLCVHRALRELVAINALTPLDRILLTGDVTDAGTRAEWAEFIDLLRGYPGLRTRLSFVPGNHDVNIVERTNPGRPDLPWSASQSLRKLRVVLALDAVLGDRARVVERESGALGPTLKDYLQQGERTEVLRALAQRGAIRGRWEMAKIWDEIFPLVELPVGDECGVILLNSNVRSHFSLTNAIGVVNRSQLRALKSILRNSPRRFWMILLHHQVVEYPLASISLRDRIGLALINAPDVLAAIAPYASRTVILHGHRHKDWIGRCGELVLCSAPSVTMGSGSSGERWGSFRVHELALGPDARIRLITTRRVKVD